MGHECNINIEQLIKLIHFYNRIGFINNSNKKIDSTIKDRTRLKIKIARFFSIQLDFHFTLLTFSCSYPASFSANKNRNIKFQFFQFSMTSKRWKSIPRTRSTNPSNPSAESKDTTSRKSKKVPNQTSQKTHTNIKKACCVANVAIR